MYVCETYATFFSFMSLVLVFWSYSYLLLVAFVALLIKYRWSVRPNVCTMHSKTHLNGCTHLGGASLYFVGPCHMFHALLSFIVQIVCCHQYTKKGEIVRAYFPWLVLVIDDNMFCGLTVCVELCRYSYSWLETVYVPSVDGTRRRSFLFDFGWCLSRRKSVLLRGDPPWNGGWNHHTCTHYAPTISRCVMEQFVYGGRVARALSNTVVPLGPR